MQEADARSVKCNPRVKLALTHGPFYICRSARMSAELATPHSPPAPNPTPFRGGGGGGGGKGGRRRNNKVTRCFPPSCPKG